MPGRPVPPEGRDASFDEGVVVIPPLGFGQDEVVYEAESGCRDGLFVGAVALHARIALRPESLDLGWPVVGEPGGIGHRCCSSGREQTSPRREAAFEANVVDGSLGPDQIEALVGVGERVHRSADGVDSIGQARSSGPLRQLFEKGVEQIDAGDVSAGLGRQKDGLASGTASEIENSGRGGQRGDERERPPGRDVTAGSPAEAGLDGGARTPSPPSFRRQSASAVLRALVGLLFVRQRSRCSGPRIISSNDGICPRLQLISVLLVDQQVAPMRGWGASAHIRLHAS